ncbi:MAG: hypothetical protein HY851_03490, partial [candidate division Zixibacteria bacterium]|nr:hypothetical protein [candidate division Zixibacteria bacterium]
DIHANKPQYEFRRRYGSWYLGIGLILFLVAANLVIWWWVRKRKRDAESVGRRAPWEVASERLARLEQKNLPAEGKFREYYFELTELARDYLGRMYSADVLEMTTEEFLDHFRAAELPTGMFDSCSALLRHADLVKFAKYVPEVERCHADFQAVRALIEQVRADYERKRAAEIAAAQTPPSPTAIGGGTRG